MVGPLILLLAIVAIVIVGIISVFNRIQTLENRFENAWSQIDVQLKRRNDLIPNLVETVKGYASHEKDIFESVAASRSKMMGAGNVSDQAQAANAMTSALGRLFAIAENYPDLKANENFRVLQEELAGVESKIAYARQFYNDAVLQYNNAIETFPGVLFAGPMSKDQQVYLEIPATEREAPKVSFS
ncbi:MAG: LemA family protein [Deinococcota bacterium]